MIEDLSRSWVEVDLAALRHNARIAASVGPGRLMAVVKANGYGHGAVEVARALETEASVQLFGVAGVGEALELKLSGITRPILILGSCLADERKVAIEHNLIVMVSTLSEAQEFSRLAESLGCLAKVHLSIDTGMGRIGFLPDEWLNQIDEIFELPGLEIEGVATHFPSADEDHAFTSSQIVEFSDLIKPYSNRFREVHLANSAGLLGYAEQELGTLVRPGLMLYGASPLPGFEHGLRPVMALKSRVTLVRNLPAGSGISYGRTHVIKESTSVATVSIGYGDGYMRHLSGRDAEVLVSGKRCRLLGRVTMDQIMIDVGGLSDVRPGDEVCLFGDPAGLAPTVGELATLAGTIPWEVLTGITPRVRRVYL